MINSIVPPLLVLLQSSFIICVTVFICILMCAWFSCFYWGTPCTRSWCNTTKQSCLYRAIYLFMHVLSINICTISSLVLYLYFPRLFLCRSSTVYIGIYFYPQPQPPLAPTFPRHFRRTIHAVLYTYHVYDIKIVG